MNIRIKQIKQITLHEKEHLKISLIIQVPYIKISESPRWIPLTVDYISTEI